MRQNYIGEPDIVSFSRVSNALRAFFLARGFVEVNTQDRLSILAACEDPTTVATYQYAGELWPLPQTGQMWLEYELLTRPEVPGVFCLSTSYRQEPNPIPGRHRIIFPMFEFESRGTMAELRALEEDLLEHLQFGEKNRYYHANYDDLAGFYGVEELTSEHENRMPHDFGRVTFLERFPERTSPFWNMRRDGPSHANKIDVIIDGMETIGSAERSSNPTEMRERFHTISGGNYAQLLYDKFGRERVERELEDFLSLPFVERYGGGIGMTRLIRAVKNHDLVYAISV